MIRPENEASQSLYKKLGFRKVYQTVRMTFAPDSWQGSEDEAHTILRNNLENAVRQLNIQRSVIDSLQVDDTAGFSKEPVDNGEEETAEPSVDVVEEPDDWLVLKRNEDEGIVVQEANGEEISTKDVDLERIEEEEAALSNEDDGGTDEN